jgi:2-polyprenyl-3-methyl-5-hydroxy-6-metoxy-1,4-benzoquinol methylase
MKLDSIENKQPLTLDSSTKRVVNCPICEISDFDVKYNFSEKKKHNRIVRCRKCRLLYSNPRQDCIDYYRKDSPYHDIYLKYLKGKYKLFEHKFYNISKFIKKGRLLDIGCGPAIFLDIADKHGWNVEGIELNSDSVNWAKEKFDFVIYENSFENQDLCGKKYDLISLFNVFEHLNNPNSILKKINFLLNPGGYLAIELPNIESIQVKIFGDSYLHFIYAHHWYFSKKNITQLLGKWNFIPVYFGYSPRFYQLNYILEYSEHYFIKAIILKKILNRVIKIFNKLKFDPIIKVSLRDYLFIIAEKSNS